MKNIINIKGNVQFPITLDPSVWIFDDRKFDINTYFEQKIEENDWLEEYTKAVSKHWDREIIEGAEVPTEKMGEKKFKKEIILSSSFGISFQPFLANAVPLENAESVIIETANEEVSVPIEKAKKMILQFSKSGKPIVEGGPVYAYYADGSNKGNPIKTILSFRVV